MNHPSSPPPHDPTAPPTAPPARAERGKDAQSVLLTLERQARQAKDKDALRFHIVTLTRHLVGYRQAILLRGTPKPGKPCHWRVDAVSNAPILDRNAPFLQWVERVCAALPAAPPADDELPGQPLTPGAVSAELAEDWAAFALPHVLWMPIICPNRGQIGGLWLSREADWTPAERTLLSRLAETYGHALAAQDLFDRDRSALRRFLPERFFRPSDDTGPKTWKQRAFPWVAAAAATALMFVPVTQSALAPVEVVAVDPMVIAAPVAGVIDDFAVRPNQAVQAGDLLYRFEDEPLRADRDIAAKSLAVAQAEHHRAAQQAFANPNSKAELALLDAQVALRQAELTHAQERLDRTEVRAPRDGVVIFSDVNDWLGRPVSVGERVMVLADPNKVELRADLPTQDAIDLPDHAPMRAFLDAAPLSPLDAQVHQVSYEARMSEKNVLSFVVRGTLATDETPPRLGLKGTAKLEGESVPLILYLLRRPLTALRQMTGL